MVGGGFGDHVANIGDWMPPTPSPRSLFSALFDSGSNSKSFLSPTHGRGNESLLLEPSKVNGQQQATGSGDLLAQLSESFPEQKTPNLKGGLVERMAARSGLNAPRLNTESIRSSDISLKPDIQSPYLTIPPGLSPASLLDSPVFLSNSLAQPSPTTGKFPFLQNVNPVSSMAPVRHNDNLFEDSSASPFEFKPPAEQCPSFSPGGASQISRLQSENSAQSQGADVIKAHSRNQSLVGVQSDFSMSVAGTAAMQLDEDRDQKGGGDTMAGGAEDGYNWRKYGQKQVKGSEYPRSYYKCANPNCPVKKKVERSQEGLVTEIIYKGVHSHAKPPLNRRSANGSPNLLCDTQVGTSEQARQDVGTPDWSRDSHEATSSADYCNPSSPPSHIPNGAQVSGDALDVSTTFSNGEDEDDRGTHGSVSLGNDGEEDEHESKRRKIEAYATEMSGATRAVRKPRVVVQTTSEVDILDDGYRWRKYGQKVVKGNPNPRSYYKCTNSGCDVRKHVERASHDFQSVITTYEGKHNHDIPAARNSASHASSGVGAGTGNGTVAAATAIELPHNSRPKSLQCYNGLGAGALLGSLGFHGSGRQQLVPPSGPAPSFSFGMGQPGGLVNLAMAGLIPANPYFGQQQHQQQRQFNDLGFVMPKGEPKVEPVPDLGLNVAAGGPSMYRQIMGQLSLGPQM